MHEVYLEAGPNYSLKNGIEHLQYLGRAQFSSHNLCKSRMISSLSLDKSNILFFLLLWIKVWAKVTSSLFFSSWANFSKVEASIDFRRFSASCLEILIVMTEIVYGEDSE